MKDVLFMQGSGNGGYETNKTLVASLQKSLGEAYEVHYLRMVLDESKPILQDNG
jgi:hypothetical protein